ncbi:MAG: tRNA (adenosine(37)-N6)-threonylcarbamoyltransferase complex ATPase subunit type 1 TsaE [Betaproteobacteria bacterium]|nr:tRNA (adenosine(37)-N6)-threonylcarbamoyltransferase complex ATPase subunit type 1 TsaE [Betaproteobacteria bacterium]
MDSSSPRFLLPDEAATAACGAALWPFLTPGMVVYLEGGLGSGKTALARAVLRAGGYSGPVKSPSYSLVEVYVFSRLYLYHFDFYRFNGPEEFLDAGLDEYFRNDSVCLVEWPDKARPYLPPPSLVVSLAPGTDSEFARILTLSACDERGLQCLNAFLKTSTAVEHCAT